jgi:DNA-directed RNA polymerase specialized sigma24 family protein
MKLTKSQLKQIIKEELEKLSISEIDEALSTEEEEMMSIASQAAQYIKDELGLRPGEEENFIEYLSTVMRQPAETPLPGGL